MKTKEQIEERFVEVKGELRRLDNKCALDMEMSAEEYEVIDALASEYDTLEWVMRP